MKYPYYKEVVDRFSALGIDLNEHNVLIISNGAYFNGDQIDGYPSISKDNCWVCIPVLDERLSCNYGTDVYSPKCYEILNAYTTYLGKGILSLTTVYLLA